MLESKPEIVTTNQVRQVLFNELGLTREYIRELVRGIVTWTVSSYLNSDTLNKFIRGEIDKALRTNHYGTEELKKLIANAVASTVSLAIKESILDRLRINIDASAALEPTAD